MARYRLEYTKQAGKQLAKLDRQHRRRVREFLEQRVATEEPRRVGKALHGDLAGLWRYRVGQLRIVADIRDDTLVVLVLQVEQRSSVYRR